MAEPQLLLLAFIVMSAIAEKVIISEEDDAGEFCDWKIKNEDNNGKWKPLLPKEANPQCNKLCGKGTMKWYILSPAVDVKIAMSVNISLNILLDYRSKNPTVILLAAQTKTGRPQQFEYKPVKSTILRDYANTVTYPLTKTDAYLNIGLYVPDLVSGSTPECLTVSKATLSYNKCPFIEAGMATFPDVIAPAGRGSSRVEGKCKPYAVPQNSDGVWLDCDMTGSVSKVHGCHCRAGFQYLSRNCTVCAEGTYKDSPGNHKCSKCGRGSVSSRDGTICPCLTGSRESIGKATSSDDCKTLKEQYLFITINVVWLVVTMILCLILVAVAIHLRQNNNREERQHLLPNRNNEQNGNQAQQDGPERNEGPQEDAIPDDPDNRQGQIDEDEIGEVREAIEHDI